MPLICLTAFGSSPKHAEWRGPHFDLTLMVLQTRSPLFILHFQSLKYLPWISDCI